MEYGKSRWEIESKQFEEKQKSILQTADIFTPGLAMFKVDMETFKTRCDLLSTKINAAKESLSKSVYSPSHSVQFEVSLSNLDNKNIEIDQLKAELTNLKLRYSSLGYPAFTSLFEFSKLEFDLRQRELEINSYLKEKDMMRQNIQKIRGDSIFVNPSISHPNIYISESPSRYPYTATYLRPYERRSPAKMILTSNVKELSPLQKYYEEKSLELKSLMIESEQKRLTEEATRRQLEIKDLRRRLDEKDFEIDRYISQFFK